ncbi:hypothetical protein V1277_005099 [Bradyrhizobium sp. AZCC 1588]
MPSFGSSCWIERPAHPGVQLRSLVQRLTGPLSRSGRSRNLHLRFFGSTFLENDGTCKRLAVDKLLPRLQQHHVISVVLEFGRLALRDWNGLDLAHGWRAFAAIDRVLYGEIRERTADAQQGVGFGRIVPDRHHKREIDTDLIGRRHPGVRHLQRFTCRGEPARQPKSNSNQSEHKKRNPAAAIKPCAIST